MKTQLAAWFFSRLSLSLSLTRAKMRNSSLNFQFSSSLFISVMIMIKLFRLSQAIVFSLFATQLEILPWNLAPSRCLAQTNLN